MLKRAGIVVALRVEDPRVLISGESKTFFTGMQADLQFAKQVVPSAMPRMGVGKKAVVLSSV